MNSENKQLKKEYPQKMVTSLLTKQHKKKWLIIGGTQKKLNNEQLKPNKQNNKLNHKQKQNVRNVNDWKKNWRIKSLRELKLFLTTMTFTKETMNLLLIYKKDIKNKWKKREMN